MINMPLKGEYMWSKNLKEKLLWFMQILKVF